MDAGPRLPWMRLIHMYGPAVLWLRQEAKLRTWQSARDYPAIVKGKSMNLLENINSRPLPLAQLMGITFTHAEPDKVIARMVVRPDLCTLGHTIHGGSAMAFADTTGGAATLINL